MALEIESDGRTLRLRGELDVATEPQLNEAFHPLTEGGGTLTIDLSALDFIDSSGVRAIVRGAGALGDQGILELRDPGPAVQRVLDLMRLDTIPNVKVTHTGDPST
ncbi:MAG TPA: STAS domain-containing protein [Actinomycetota bacterium]|nr:STAS domain-containing protein [Actinomycetota bacterium]